MPQLSLASRPRPDAVQRHPESPATQTPIAQQLTPREWTVQSRQYKTTRAILSRRKVSMRRLILAATLGLALSTNVGCFLPIYSGDPAVRTQELIHTSED